jgi:uncharacterized OB-fold protein
MNKQMNPVLLPKRKEFGFLKPPSSSVTSSMSMNGSLRRNDLINNNNNTASNARLINSKETSSSSKQAYIFDPLKIKYEISNHLFGKSYTNRQTSSSQLMSTAAAAAVGVSTSTPPKSDSITHPRRLFRGMTGYNVRNKIKRHQLLSLPVNFTTNMNQTNNNNKLINKGMSKLDATQFLEQLINKRKEKSIYNQNCRNCGINYFENNKCLYCEYNNSNSNNNTNVVWLPNLARQTITTAAFTTTNNNNNKHENSFTFAIPESETSVSISSKPYRYTAASGKQQSFLKKKATTDIDFFSIKKPTTTYETTQTNLKQINENKNNNNRDEKVKSTASDYYGDSTLIDEPDDSLNINNNRNNVSYVSNNDFNYNNQHTNSFQQYDSNYKYDSSKEEDGQENDYQNVVPKLTLWLV